MQLRFVSFGLFCLAVALFLALSRGAGDPPTLVVGGLGVGALVGAKLAGAPKRKLDARFEAPEHSRAFEEEASLLSANLEAIADARVGIGLAFAGRERLDVFLSDSGETGIAVIKALRTHLAIGLKEAKDFTDVAQHGGRPLLARGMQPEAARSLARDVAAAGGRVEFE